MRYLILTCTVWMAACGNASRKEKELLNEASLVHNEAVALARDTENHLKQLEGDSFLSVDSIRLWKKLLAQWNEELVEVPGNEHEHDHNHAHNHHQTTVQVTGTEMLDIQRNLKERIEQLNKRVGVE